MLPLALLPLLLGSLNLRPALCPLDPEGELEKYAEKVEGLADESEELAGRLGILLNRVQSFSSDSPIAPKSTVDGSIDIGDLTFCYTDSAEKKCVNADSLSKALRSDPAHRAGADQAIEIDPSTGLVVPVSLEQQAFALEQQAVPQLQLEEDEEEEEPIPVIALSSISIQKKLGEGGFKTVYKGTYGGATVAVAVIVTKSGGTYLTSSELTAIDSELTLQDKFREQKIAGKHMCRDFIMRILGVHKQKSTTYPSEVKAVYIVMDLAGGGDLSSTKYSNTHKAVGAAIQMAAGLKCVHSANYVHKDVKPLNTLQSTDQKTLWTHDFGLVASASSGSALRRLAGTRYYMPWDDHHETAEDSVFKYDVFALGKSFEELDIHKYIGSAVVNQMKGPASHRPTIDDLLVVLANKALEPLVDQINAQTTAVQELRNKIRIQKALIDNEEARLLDDRRTLRTIRDENFFESIVRCCTSRVDKAALESRVVCRESTIDKARLAKVKLERDLKKVKDDLKLLQDTKVELYSRLTLADLPGVPIDNLMSGKALG
eukprot:c9479_g1_i1.p1 GENE.c9479_g1_i1~~c9479_g1_i1.p1  ORF type:complete len:544 (-),score=135.78 c9479_g1_i1:90-1721(-)